MKESFPGDEKFEKIVNPEIPKVNNANQNPKEDSPHEALTYIDPRTGRAVTKKEFEELMKQYREEQR